jgi:transcriptional adapter 2-alpha
MKRLSDSNDRQGTKRNKKVDPRDDIPIEATSEPVQYHCDYCSKDISNTVRIRCAVCDEFEVCIECFIAGVELKGHQSTHNYRVIDNMHFPFFETSWSADEEYLLLEGLEESGVGNWTDIAENFGATKTPNQIRDHWMQFYLQSPQWPCVDYSNIIATRERVKQLNSGAHIDPAKKRIKKIDPLKSAKKKNPKQTGVKQQKAPSKIELNGYMPLRNEFENEWDNECESKVKDIAFEDNDTPEEAEAKLQMLKCYNYRLEIRKKRCAFVVEKNLHDTKALERQSKLRTKEHRELYNSYRRYLQIMSPDEYEAFTRGLADQKALETRILQLQEHRKKGITSLAEASRYDEEALSRDTEKAKGRYWNKKNMSRRMNQPMDLEGQPGFNFLSDQERELCKNSHILPHQYVLCKETLMREYVKSGDVIKNTPCQLETEKAQKVFEFMQEAGWINNNHHTVAQQLPDAPDTTKPSNTSQQQPQQFQEKQHLQLHPEQNNQQTAFYFVPNSPTLPIFHLHNQKYVLSKPSTYVAGGWQNNSRMA